MGKQDDNVKIIIDYLSEGPKTADEIIKKVGFSSSSWKKYTGHVNKRLAAEGKKLQLLKGSYSIVYKDSNIEDADNPNEKSDNKSNKKKMSSIDEGDIVETSSRDTVMKVLVLNALSQKASRYVGDSNNGLMTSRELTETVFSNSTNSLKEVVEDGKVIIKYPYSTIDSILGANKLSSNKQIKKKGLIQEGLVEMSDAEKASQRTYDLTPKAPVYLKLGYEAGSIDLWDIKNALQYGGQGYAFSDVLKGIEDIITVFDNDDFYNIEDYYRDLGIRGNKNSNIEKNLNKLSKLDFKKYLLEIEYKPAHPTAGKDLSREMLEGKLEKKLGKKTEEKSGGKSDKKNQIENHKFAVGLVVYVSDKDRLYLLGKDKGSNECIILNTERIKKVSETKMKNNIYGSSEFIDIYHEMFSISVDEPFELKVEFQNTFNIYEKIKRMSAVRPNAVISLKSNDENTIVYYEEKVRGVEDVARWLRSFGRSVKVIKPYILKDRMKSSIERALANYGEGKEDE